MPETGTLADIVSDNFWDARVGPFYDADGVAKLTGLSAVELASRVQAGDALAVITSDGVLIYPVFQFGAHGLLLPALRTVAEILRPISDDEWDVATWLVTRSDRFGGMSAASVLRAGDVDVVLAAAHRDARMLNS